MRRVLIILFLWSNIFANESYELKLFEKILPSLFEKSELLVYADNKTERLLRGSHYLHLSKSCKNVDILVGRYFDNLDKECQEKPFFTTYYREFKNNAQAVGAFYWRKGRPQLKFHRFGIEKYHLNLNKSLEKYLEE